MRLAIIIICLLLFGNVSAQEKNGSFEVIRHLYEDNGSFTNTVYRVSFGPDGKCYFGSNKGLGSYNGHVLQHLTTQDGLPDNQIFNIRIKDSILYFLPLKGGLYSYNFLRETPLFKKQVELPDVLKDIVIRDTSMYLSTYSYIFSKSASGKLVKNINFKWKLNKAIVFGDNFYLKSEDAFLKYNIHKNTKDTILRNSRNFKTLCVLDTTVFYSCNRYFYSKNTLSQTKDSVAFSLFPESMLPETIWPVNDSLFFMVIDHKLITFNRKTGLTETLLDNVDVNDISYNPLDHHTYICTNNKGLYILNQNHISKTCTNTFKQTISYLQVTPNASDIGFENGDVLLDGNSYTGSYKVNSILRYKTKLFFGVEKGCIVQDITSKKILYEKITTVKKAILIDSIVYFTGSNSLSKLNLNTFSLETMIKKNHRSYYLQCHQRSLYTQSYNTDSLLKIDLGTEKITALQHIKGQIISSIQVNHKIYFITDLAHLYIYDQKTVSSLYIPDYLYYPLTNISHFYLYNHHFLIGNNEAFVTISVNDLEQHLYHFSPLTVPLPADAEYVQVNNNTIYYTQNNSIWHFPVKSIHSEKAFYHLTLKKSEITSYRDHLFSKSFGRFSAQFETVDYTGKDGVMTYYIISPGQLRIQKNKPLTGLVIDSLPVGTSYLVCFSTNNRLNKSNILSVPIYITNKSTKETIISLAMYGLGILLIAFIVFRYILRNLKKQHDLKMESVLLEQKVSALLMNPHFVFNALSNIQGFIGSKQLETANTYLLKFSLVIRSYINFMIKGIISLTDELESINHFVEFQKIKYEGKLELSVSKAPGLTTDRIHIPAFILQPFIENSIKYFKNHKPVLQIDMHITALSNNSYTITIHDNGPGIKEEIHQSIHPDASTMETAEFKSLSFTLQRLRKTHEANKLPFSFKIENRYNESHIIEGLTVILNLSSLPGNNV